jgi:hypothetical protein
MGKTGKPIKTSIAWEQYLKYFESTPREQLPELVNSALLQLKPSFTTDLIKHYSDSKSRESFIKTATIQVMSTPEYQMC